MSNLKEALTIKDPDSLITTTKGLMRVGDLERKVCEFEDDNELTYAIEYWFDDQLVHRSVHVQLKKNVSADCIAAAF